MQSVIGCAGAVDLLQSLPQVDDDKIGFVGYGAGARTGAILASVEPRIKAFVLMSGGEDSVDEFMTLVQSEQRDEVAAAPRRHGRTEVHLPGEPFEALLPGGAEGLGRPEGRARNADQGGAASRRRSAGTLPATIWQSRSTARPARRRRGAEIEGPPRRGQRPGRRRGWRKTGCVARPRWSPPGRRPRSPPYLIRYGGSCVPS